MRYNLESTLPIHAFQPLGGRHNPFKHRMTLEGGGGGGGFLSGVTDSISSALGTDGGGGGLLGALADVDDFVGDTIPGGWSTVAAVAIPYAAPYAIAGATGATVAASALTAGQAAALAAGVSATTSAIRGDEIQDILKNAALSGATSYGLSSLGNLGGAENIDLNVPHVDMPDGVYELGSSSIPAPSYDVPSESFNPPDESFNSPVESFDPPDEFNVPAELDLNALYKIQPDGINQLSYDPAVNQEVLAASSAPPIVKDEEAFEKLFRQAQETSVPSSSVDDFGPNMNDLGAGTSPYGEANELPNITETTKDPFSRPPASLMNDPKGYLSDKATQLKLDSLGAYDYLTQTSPKQMGLDLFDLAADNKLATAAIGLGALQLMGGREQQPQGSPAPSEEDSRYTGGYGSPGRSYDQYLLRDRVNAQNIYGYRNPNAYAEGGEVKRFGLGGLSRAVTRFTQPIEKAVVQPIGNAVPFLREAAPYAGLIAAPFISSPMMAAGVGALSSGFGTPGSGFNMKRAMMGGMAAYGMSNIGAGIEAAGTPAVDAAVSTPDAATGFFRSPDAMGAGIKNLAGGSTYAPAAAQFATKAGIPSAGMTIMGTSGVMAIDEGIKQQALADAATAATRGENQEFLNRIAAGKKRAEQAVRENPYQYAMGGSVDDEYGMDEARGMMQGNLQKGLFGQGFAAGGMPNLALSRMSQPAFNEGAVGGMPQFAAGGQPRFLSGGGDGMSDSIKATIEGNQEARLADGEFVIPADVVSHLGNGSSKAGAKQLYSMMDRVRQARVGNKKQGREITPKKLMPA